MNKILLFLLMAVPVAAQTTTYTGTIKDLSLNVVTSGQVQFTLTPPTDSTLPGIGRFTPTMFSCNINADGTLSGYVAGVVSGACIVVSNTAISPSGTAYKICIQPYNQTPGSCFYDYALGGTKDITTIAPTLQTGPLNYGGVAGPAATVAVGSVTTGVAGTPATVRNVGTTSAAVLNFVIPQGPIGSATSGVNLTPGASQTIVQPPGTALNINNLLPSIQPFKCAEAYLSTSDGQGGTDYGYAINAAVADSSLTSSTQINVCAPGDHPVYTAAVFDRPVAFHMDGKSRLIPQSSLSSTPINVNGATATAGSMNLTVPSSTGILVNMAVGGIGIPPGAYVTAVSGTTVTISLPANIQFYGMASSGAATITGVSSMVGLSTGQVLNGINTWPFVSGTTSISSIDYVNNVITASSNATITTQTPTTFAISGSWLTNLTFVKTTPVLSFVYNQNALHNNFGQMYGSSLHDVWIEDISAIDPTDPFNTVGGYPGITGVQIVGYDQFSSTNLHVEYVQGSCLILGGTASQAYDNGFFSPVREASFFGDQIRNCGDNKTGQAALVIMTPNENNQSGADENNDINFFGGRYVLSSGVAVEIGTYNQAHTGTRAPGSILFSGTQIEGGAVNADTVPVDDSVYIAQGDNIHFKSCILNQTGQGRALIRVDVANYISIDDCFIAAGALIPTTYQVALTAGITTGTFVSNSGRANGFNTTQRWDGMGVDINGTKMHLAPLSPVNSSGTTITLASPWSGASGTFTMTAGYGGVYTQSSLGIGHLFYGPNDWTPQDSGTLLLIGNPTISNTFYVGAGFTGTVDSTQDVFNRLHYSVGQVQYGAAGPVPDTSLQGTSDTFNIAPTSGAGVGINGETDVVNVKGTGTGGWCLFNQSNNVAPTAPVACFTGTGGLNLSDVIKLNGTAAFSGTKTGAACVFTISGGLITNVTGC